MADQPSRQTVSISDGLSKKRHQPAERPSLGSQQSSQNYLSGGMLISTMIELRMTGDFDRVSSARELLTAALPEKLDSIRGVTEAISGHTAETTAGEAGA